ncbi:hypothetical protein AUC70_10745 [Methyloceanibacter stevinii]|uniref:Uncharacterized protein n=1 Tax=Methyloceanibacter stevinii TaxID=1774970 RepID=A0A1E3VKJ1_9HYPH|nr:hypothetical protein [Methyloceanibacter stevinii]ODR94045.1 hypothetical protein AUC70_10745 [Methyloceanibacter stevinii]
MKAEATAGAEAQTVPWWTAPGHTDMTSFMALILLFLLVFGVFHVYARFDKFAEEHNEGTPLKTTIPTLLMVAFAYEIFPPLSHFSILLPLALIVTALARDLMLWFEPRKEHILKGELESAMLDELHHEHLGEHDHTGRRVPDEPEAAPPPKPAPKRKTRTAKSDPPEESGAKPDARLDKRTCPRREGRKRD